jgi:homoserine dehydrogenase
MTYKLAIIGFGTVGQGFAELLQEKGEYLKNTYGLEFEVVAISDPIKGAVYEKDGLDLKEILSLMKREGRIDGYGKGIKGWDSIKTIRETNAQIITEVTPTDLESGEPGITHIRTALRESKHVITTNKGPIALFYRELIKLAQEKGEFLKFEGTVLSGTPAINLGLFTLAGAYVKEIRGIVNGTTNFILTRMDEGKDYNGALKEAQRLGYAETKPDADVEGWDALAKVLILSNVFMNGDLKVSDVERRGITGITSSDIREAKEENRRYKLIARVWREDGEVRARVSPEKVKESDILFHISGVDNAIQFQTDTLGCVTIVGPGAGKRETGFALLSDLISIHRSSVDKEKGMGVTN